jgi:hypothetical protein
MREHRESSHPPSDPHPALTRGSGAGFAVDDRPARAQLAAALLLGVMLVGGGLYLWRKPHASADATSSEALAASASAAAMEGAVAIVSATADSGALAPVKLSDVRVLACQDRGPRRTPAEQCDRLAPVEQALSRAIEQSATCVPPTGAGSSIEYVADVSFSRHKVHVAVPRSGRAIDDRKALSACAAAVRGAMQALTLETISHDHARYKIAVTATYLGSSHG